MSGRVTTRHRSAASSEDCGLCGQVLGNFERHRPLTSNQATHYETNRAILDERARMEILDEGGHR